MSVDILALLKEIEWNVPLAVMYCPSCSAPKYGTHGEHKPGCQLKAAIAELEAQGQAIKVGAYRVLAGMGLV